ncbi:hypothetical protein [Microbacterium sp.]|uniref:hypothetical protein n=1 Tax=Microbacterium sp. TaxID=51671 RepID=UPI003F952931
MTTGDPQTRFGAAPPAWDTRPLTEVVSSDTAREYELRMRAAGALPLADSRSGRAILLTAQIIALVLTTVFAVYFGLGLVASIVFDDLTAALWNGLVLLGLVVAAVLLVAALIRRRRVDDTRYRLASFAHVNRLWYSPAASPPVPSAVLAHQSTGELTDLFSTSVPVNAFIANCAFRDLDVPEGALRAYGYAAVQLRSGRSRFLLRAILPPLTKGRLSLPSRDWSRVDRPGWHLHGYSLHLPSGTRDVTDIRFPQALAAVIASSPFPIEAVEVHGPWLVLVAREPLVEADPARWMQLQQLLAVIRDLDDGRR